MDTPQYHQLHDRYLAATDERDKIDALIDMAMEVRSYDVERALSLATEIIARSERERYRLGRGRGKNLQGWCYWQGGNYDESLHTLQDAYAIARDIRNRPLEARVLNNFGYIYRDRGDLATALNYFENALAINEELGDEVAQSVNLAAIAYLLYDLGEYDQAHTYALKCLPIFEEAKDTHRLTALYHILGNIYFKKDQPAAALRYFQENLTRNEPGTVMHDLSLTGIGKVNYRMGHLEEADARLKEALKTAHDSHNVEAEISCNYYLGRMAMDDGHYRRALAYLEESMRLADSHSRRHDVMSIHETLSQLYEETGNIPKAYEHLKAFERIKEEIFNQSTFDKLRNLQVRQTLEMARKEKEVAEETALLKQQFMANMSHEIRTPMNAIVGMTRLLLNQSPQPGQMRYLQAIRQSADNLLVIINDILDLSKIEAGKIIIEQVPFSLSSLMDGVADMLMLKAEDKGLALLIDIGKDVPYHLLGDPTRISQVLINLAGNAVKFTEQGSITLSATCLEHTADQCRIRLDVADTGIGIAPDYVDKIFESFTQAGTDVARKFGGTGLGLTISRQLVTLMHGEVFVHSELGKGTIFSVVLPLAVAPEQEERNTDEAGTSVDQMHPALCTARILLVEDNEFNRMVAIDTLEELLPESCIDTAENGQLALDKLRDVNYDVVLMDIQMPVMDGLAATRIIREEWKSRIPIIAMTANVLQENVQEYADAGMDGYVSKPFEPEQLLSQMSHALGTGVRSEE